MSGGGLPTSRKHIPSLLWVECREVVGPRQTVEFTKISSTTFELVQPHIECSPTTCETSGMGDGAAKESKSLASQNTGLVTSLLMSHYGSTNVSRIPIGCGQCSHELSHLTQFSTPVVPNMFCIRKLFFRIFPRTGWRVVRQ